MLKRKDDPRVFGHFFAELKSRLNYAIGIGEYEEFLQLILTDEGFSIVDEKNGLKLWEICRAMFLRYPKDEQLFREVFQQAIDWEQKRLVERLSDMNLGEEQEETHEEDPDGRYSQTVEALPDRKVVEENGEEGPSTPSSPETIPEQLSQGKQPKDKYLNYFLNAESDEEKTIGTGRKYDLSSSYFPIPSREMVQAWRFLRRWEKRGSTTELDIEATIKDIATKGYFTELIYQERKVQREDALLIFADRQGSMVAFHDLTEKLIQAATVEGGGHARASVYYFNNYPIDLVYKEAGLTHAITLKETLRRANPNNTVALIISDAGAGRGNLKKKRIRGTWEFLDLLKENVLRVTWLNPMPEERWANTTAQYVAMEVPMFPILEAKRYGFTRAISTLAGKAPRV